MSVKINDVSIRVVCPEGHENHIHIYDWEQSDPEIYETSEKRMGPQTCHRFTLDGVRCSHPSCLATIDAEIEVWEYPEGIEEYASSTPNVDATDAGAAVQIEAT